MPTLCDEYMNLRNHYYDYTILSSYQDILEDTYVDKHTKIRCTTEIDDRRHIIIDDKYFMKYIPFNIWENVDNVIREIYFNIKLTGGKNIRELKEFVIVKGTSFMTDIDQDCSNIINTFFTHIKDRLDKYATIYCDTQCYGILLVYEYVVGDTLYEWSKKNHGHNEEGYIFNQLTECITWLNHKGIQHTDLHGGNIIVDGSSKIFIIDFEYMGDTYFIPKLGANIHSTVVMNRVLLEKISIDSVADMVLCNNVIYLFYNNPSYPRIVPEIFNVIDLYNLTKRYLTNYIEVLTIEMLHILRMPEYRIFVDL